jgi:hypothetical protein
MPRLRQLHAGKVVLLRKGDLPISRSRQLQAEKLVLLPLLGGVIASIIYLVAALDRLPPWAADHAAPSVSEDHQPLRDHG